MQKFKTNEAYLPIMALTYFIMLMFKYCLESWNNDYKESINSALSIVHIASWGWIIYALHISNNKERVFFVFIVMFFLLNVLIVNIQYSYWMVTAYPLFIFFSRLDFFSKTKIVFISQTAVLTCFLLLLPFSKELFFIDDRYIRFTGGFGNPNTLSSILLSYYLSMALFFNRYFNRRKFLFSFFIVVIGMLFLYAMYYTYSRTHIALLMLSMLLFSLPIWGRFIGGKTITVAILVGVAGQIYLSLSFIQGGDISLLVNEFTSGRVRLSANLFMNLIAPKVFYGVDITEYNPIDFFYISTMFSGGVIYFSFFLFLLIKLIVNSEITSRLFYLVFLVMVITSYTEAYYNIVILNFTILFLYQKKRQRDLE